jgi:hypothetical protein
LESRGNYDDDDAPGIRFVELLEPIKYNESDAYCVLILMIALRLRIIAAFMNPT